MREPKVHVGILSETKIEFIFPDTYRVNEEEVSGKQLVLFDKQLLLLILILFVYQYFLKYSFL